MKKLYKSSSDKIISGVLGGLGDFLNIESTILRLICVVLAFRSIPSFFLIYLIASIIIPKDDGLIYNDNYPKNKKDNTRVFMGIGLIVLGILLLFKMFLPSIDIRILPRINMIFRELIEFWPVLLIVLGIYIIFNQRKEK